MKPDMLVTASLKALQNLLLVSVQTNRIPFKKNEILNAKKDHFHQVLNCVLDSKTIQKLK